MYAAPAVKGLKNIKTCFFYIQVLKDSLSSYTFEIWATVEQTLLAHSKIKGLIASCILNPVLC